MVPDDDRRVRRPRLAYHPWLCRHEVEMTMGRISRGFQGKRTDEADASRLPPGQYRVDPDFPVLSASPTPHTPLDEWTCSIAGEVAGPKTWNWEEFQALPSEEIRTDIHCVTKWSKLDTTWKGVSIDTLLEGVEHDATHVLAFSDGDYTTNVPLEDLVDGKAWVAFAFDGQPLEDEHGGPARLLVPHLYFWKSAKWVRGLQLMDHDEPGFWEDLRLPHVRGPMARAAVLRRLSWRLGKVAELIDETPRVRSIVLNVPDWPGHRAGQHVV